MEDFILYGIVAMGVFVVDYLGYTTLRPDCKEGDAISLTVPMVMCWPISAWFMTPWIIINLIRKHKGQ